MLLHLLLISLIISTVHGRPTRSFENLEQRDDSLDAHENLTLRDLSPRSQAPDTATDPAIKDRQVLTVPRDLPTSTSTSSSAAQNSGSYMELKPTKQETRGGIGPPPPNTLDFAQFGIGTPPEGFRPPPKTSKVEVNTDLNSAPF